MFTGIVKGTFPVVFVERQEGIARLQVQLDDSLVSGLEKGASVSIDGVCLTATGIKGTMVSFDIIAETLAKTTLDALHVGRLVNVERSLRFGNEVGGHLLSGHIYGTAVITRIDKSTNNHIVTLQCQSEWMCYILEKGYIALNGASLTVVDVHEEGSFSVHLIPETLQLTNLGTLNPGDRVNVELDSQTQAIVEAVKRYLTSNLKESPL